MKMKKIALFIISIIILMFFFIPRNVYAKDIAQDIKDKATEFINIGREGAEGKNGQDAILPSSTLQEKFIPIGRILVEIATVVLLVVVPIMGIKYITANPEQQGKLKQQLIGLVVSIVVIYGAVGIWTTIQNIMNSLDI